MICPECGYENDFYPHNKRRCKACVIKRVMAGKRSYADGEIVSVEHVEKMKHLIRQERLDKMQEVA